MSFFSDAELDSLKISNMILHVVGGDKFVEESEHDVEHDNFFLQRILDTNADSVYSFNARSDTKLKLEEIEAGKSTFEKAAQYLSRQFSGRHVGSSRDGAFFIFRLVCDAPGTVFYTLIKYDYREAIERTEDRGASILRRIVNAFVSDKKAIQKSAIVRLTDGIAALDVSTRDRSLPPPVIVEYFEKFLDVTRTLSDEELNTKAFNAVQKVVVGIKEFLPKDKTPAVALGELKTILRNRKRIGQKQLEEALHIVAGQPKDQAIVDSIIKILNKELRSARIFGLSFAPDQKKWATAAMRKVKTVEGITIIYRDDIKTIERKKDGAGEVITIKTKMISEDTLVSDTATR